MIGVVDPINTGQSSGLRRHICSIFSISFARRFCCFGSAFKFMFRYRRAALAVSTAVVLALPALCSFAWKNNVVAFAIIVANLPGILLVGKHYPPEGFPGESPLHFVLMLVVQVVLWYLLYSLAGSRSARRITGRVGPNRKNASGS